MSNRSMGRGRPPWRASRTQMAAWKRALSAALGLCLLLFLHFRYQDSSTARSAPSSVLSDGPETLSRRAAAVETQNSGRFLVKVRVDTPFIVPDIARQAEFRTSQLAVLNGRSYPSRRVLYTSNAQVSGVLVLPMDAYDHQPTLAAALEERRRYCKEHNYGLFARYIQDFASDGMPARDALGLAPVRMLRQAMEAFPAADWFWLYDPRGHIEQPHSPMLAKSGDLALAMDEGSATSGRLGNGFAQDPAAVAIIATADDTNRISLKSLAVRNKLPGWAFLELLADPLIQSYAPFLRSNNHAGKAIMHVIRTHPRLTQKMAIVAPVWFGTSPCGGEEGVRMACFQNLVLQTSTPRSRQRSITD